MMMTDGFLQLRGFKPERAHAARHDQAHVASLSLLARMVSTVASAQFRARHRHFQQNRVGGIKQPVNVLLQFEHPAVVGADALKHAIAVKQAVIEHRDFCVALAVIFAININLHAKRLQTYAIKTAEANVNFRVTRGLLLILSHAL